jgi:hypothetical protein
MYNRILHWKKKMKSGVSENKKINRLQTGYENLNDEGRNVILKMSEALSFAQNTKKKEKPRNKKKKNIAAK